MCLAVPARIISTDGIHAWIETMGVEQQINIQLIASPKIGDYIIVHAGFAIEKIDEDQLILFNETLYQMIEWTENER